MTEGNSLSHNEWKRLEDYFERRLSDYDQRLSNMIEDRYARVQLMFEASQDAVKRANEQNEKRLDLLNEFRQQAVHEQAKFVQKDIMDEKLSTLETKIQISQQEIKQLHGRVIALSGLGAIFGSAVTTFILTMFS